MDENGLYITTITEISKFDMTEEKWKQLEKMLENRPKKIYDCLKEGYTIECENGEIKTMYRWK